MPQAESDRQMKVLAKLGEITEAAIAYADAYEAENDIHTWNSQHKKADEKSTTAARFLKNEKSVLIRKLVRELHAL